MLHQLLMSLLGKPGSIIKQYDKQYRVDPSVTILTPSEASMLTSIAQTGYYYAQISSFIDSELTQLSFADLKKHPSVYRKAMAQGLKRTLQEYQQLILGIQNDFLKNRHFTFSNIKAETTRYQLVMKEIWELITRINNQKYRGGIIIDILWQFQQHGNEWVRAWVSVILKECQHVFVSQVIAWIAHGQIVDSEGEFFIHRVVQQTQQKFRFAKNNNAANEMTGWDIYTLDGELIPLSLVSLQTAGKILFIGKSVKILRSTGKISAIPGKNILNDLREILENNYCKVLFQSTIQKIRHSIAQEMIKLIIGEQNLLRELEKINDYYLMAKGDFYHHFLEEVRCIQNIANKERAQKKINQTCLQNTFIRLGQLEDAKRVFFEIKPLGFSYIGFKNFINVCPVGNIDLLQGKYIRFSASGGAIWHRTKQIVENNFTIQYSLNFKKSKLLFRTRKQELKQRKSNIISLVLQNSKDISPSFHQNPANLNKIAEYIAINVGYRYSESQKNYQSLVEVVYRNEKKYTKQICLQSFTPKKVNFLDQNVYIIKIGYANDQLKISINQINASDQSEQSCIKIDSIRISNYLNLQMSRANVGFISNIQDSNCLAEIQQWEMVCKPTNHYGDHWSDLSITLKMNWPISLILTPDLMEVFSRIHKFLFPVRQTQIDLEQNWMKIPRKMKEERRNIASLSQLKQFQIFQRKLGTLRWRMNLVLSNLWCYFQADVVQTAWPKLKSKIAASDDFQDVIRMISQYVNTIQVMYYFNALKIQRNIHDIIRQSRNYIAFFQRMIVEKIDDRTYKQFQNINDNFRKAVGDFYKLLKELSKVSNYSHLFYLTQRMEGCVDQQKSYY